ncbi:uncharacterized protein LOC143271161 [Peromyscus maniculatus bairdii]|uniref:uncharacterized protein LOC143271161 n=1 Tax=Peromyscus maniculatus bairdii TaxID=230844 RepID=UPI003FD67DD8
MYLSFGCHSEVSELDVWASHVLSKEVLWRASTSTNSKIDHSLESTFRCLSVSAAWSNARAWGAGPGADAAVSRCCRDAAAGAAALTLRASSSERHRGGAGGDAAGTERREAAVIAGLGSVICRRPGGLEALIPTLSSWRPQNQASLPHLPSEPAAGEGLCRRRRRRRCLPGTWAREPGRLGPWHCESAREPRSARGAPGPLPAPCARGSEA